METAPASLAALVSQLDSRGGSARARKKAAAALLDLAAVPANRQLVAEAGAIPAVVRLLGSGSAGVQERAAAALANLACKQAANRLSGRRTTAGAAAGQ